MALLRQRQERYLESVDYSRRALRSLPAYTTAHVNLAETLAAMTSAAPRPTGNSASPSRCLHSRPARTTPTASFCSSRAVRRTRAPNTNAPPTPISMRRRTTSWAIFIYPGGIFRAPKKRFVDPGRHQFDTHAHFGLGRSLWNLPAVRPRLCANTRADLLWTRPTPKPSCANSLGWQHLPESRRALNNRHADLANFPN